MNRSIARFVVDTHCHITTLYQPATEAGWEKVEREEWNGLQDELQPFDNSALTLYDMMKAVDKAMRIEGVTLLLKEKP